MKILITGPSLNTHKNVSGIASVVNNIFATSKCEYLHFVVGKTDIQNRNLFWLISQFLLPFKLVGILIKNKLDVFHLNAPLDTLAIIRDFVLLIIVKSFRIKTLMHLHGGKYMKSQPKSIFLYWYLKFYFSCANHIIVLSSIEKKWIQNTYNINEKKVTYLKNCVELPKKLKKKKNIKTRIIFLGRIIERKGVYNIVEALSILSEQRSDFEFYLYGAGPEEDKVIDILSQKLKNDFHFQGIVSGESKSTAFYQADVFLLPSLFGEGLPVGLLEAMSFGVIPIVTDDGSMSVVVQNAKNGYIVKKNNSVNLAQTIELLLEIFEKDEEENIRNNTLLTITKTYNCNHYAIKLESIYKSL